MVTGIFFKIGFKSVQLGELAEEEAILFETGQIHLEMVSLSRNYWGSVTLLEFLCQQKLEKYYHVVVQ